MIPVISQYVVDAVPTAIYLESVMGEAAKPAPTGVYLKNSIAPVIVPGKQYMQRVKNKTGFEDRSIGNIDEVVGNVYTLDGELVLHKSQIKEISLIPQLPVIGIRLLTDMAKAVVVEESSWLKGASVPTSKILRDYLQPHYLEDIDLCDRIMSASFDFRHSIRNYIGKDGWIMHFVKSRNTDIIVEKSCDYRIYDWNRRMQSGEW